MKSIAIQILKIVTILLIFRTTKIVLNKPLQHIFLNILRTQNIIVTQTVSDTITIDLLVSNSGELQISQIQSQEDHNNKFQIWTPF